MAAKTFLKSTLEILIFLVVLSVSTTAYAKIMYVDDDAAGANNGSSWTDAFNYLQDALNSAYSGDEIRVAQGIYKPDQGAGITPGDREATFYVEYAVAVVGGYSGLGEPDPNARNIGIYKCVLSGDLNGDDRLNFINMAENSYHVVSLSSETTLDGFTVTGGNANGTYNNGKGGGIRLPWSYDVKIYNCIIRGNTTSGVGGGIYLEDSEATIINCVFSGNEAGNSGGGLFGDISDGSTYATLANCTFNSNSAWNEGGGIHMLYVDGVTLTNCILWDNFDFTGMDELAQIYSDDVVANYSCIQGWTGSLGGIGNIGDEPLFVDSDGADHVFGTEDDNFRLLPGSPCVDTGDNLFGIDPEDFKGPPVESDLDGNPRIVDDIVDIGAYEGAKQVSYFLLSTESVTVPEDGTAAFTVALAANPRRSVEVSIAYHCGDPDISVVSPSTLLFDSSNYSQPQSVTLAAAEDPDRFDGTALILINAPGFITAGVTATEGENEPYPNVLLVDAHAPGNNNGSSWTDAFNDLQEAFRVARGIPEVKEIRVAQGEYTPAGPSGEREVSFHLVDGVAVKGGYAGFGALNPDARDIDIYKTILSGDLNDNDAVVINTEDLLDEPTRAENSYHVVNVTHCGATAVLDGFTVTGGNASEPGDENEDGAGIYNGPCYYCTSRAAVINCIITGNSARGYGGGADNCDGPITNCTITGNLARYSGGGLIECDGPISNCTISSNLGFGSYARGGGLSSCNGQITNCLIAGNSAQKGGGLTFCNGLITNCTVTANSAAEVCGGIYFCGPTTNCIVWGNSDGGDIHELAQIRGGNPVVNYCCIQGWTGDLDGTGNFGTNPCFIDSNKGDYHLLPGSPCIDAGDPNYLAQPDETDLDGKPRIMAGRIDMGAYESPIFVETRILPRTINLASEGNWITSYIWLPEGYDVAEIEPNSVFLENEIQPEQFSIDQQQQLATAIFNRQDIQTILVVGNISMKITGRLTDGTVFEATDTIKVINKAGKN